MERKSLGAVKRRREAKGDNKRLRKRGMVPSIIYGGGGEAMSIAVNDHDVEMILRGGWRSNAILDLSVEGGTESEPTVVRELDRHPVTGRLVHIDFQRIDINRDIEMEVSIHPIGADPKGVKVGGILEHIHRTITIRCKPVDMPQFLEADLTELDMNESYAVGQLELPPGVTVIDDPTTPLFSIVAPAKITAAEEEAEGEEEIEGEEEAAEPEVITKKKEEEPEE